MPKSFTLEQSITRMAQRGRRLESAPLAFHRHHLLGWRGRARLIVRRQGALLKPEDALPAQWAAVVEALAARVDAWLTDPDPDAGADIFLSPPRQPGKILARGPITMANIMDWIAAGEAGEDEGKDLDGRDKDAKGNLLTHEQIASNVWYALRSKEMRGVSIRRFLITQQMPQLDDLLIACLAGWELELIPLIRQQWRDWIAAIVRLD